MPKRKRPVSRPRQKSPRRTQAERRATSEQKIIDAAMRVISRKGTDRLTLSEVGAEAGYSRGLPAHLFGNKQGLLLHVVERYMRYVVGNTHFALPDWEPGQGMQRLRATIRIWMETGVRFPEYFRTYLILSGEAVREESTTMSAALRTRIYKINSRTREQLGRYLKQGKKHGEVAADADPDHEAMLMMSTLLGLLAFWMLDPDSFDLRKAADRCLDDLLARLELKKPRTRKTG
ncbi:transcriptional regulator [Steroidobacter denitrificans]|uniref:Transcriptional regulator n=1 Tax=Steroidobacter denitrificans TaxID=465721 RepID=A0A127F9C5_STEDE|nr:TetR/AcrR family transcriptional regulator [Steroidobacter denitrificans]AMN46200.1 transcriptional regulator [Steroidobacter denitrificans]